MTPILEEYAGFLYRYRKIINVTGARSREEIRSLVEDSLIPFPLSGRILDLGTGGGLPGLPLYLRNPVLEMAFLDKSRKKMNVLSLIIQKLDISYPLLLTGEASRFLPQYEGFFDHVISRGMGETEFVLDFAAAFLKPGGKAWLWKPTGFVPNDYQRKGFVFMAGEVIPRTFCSVAVYQKRDGEG
jgi:16S rRNA (guanine527-N7)-methyltransferase